MYLLVTPSPYSGEDLLNYKSLDCYKKFTSGWVREVLVRAVTDYKGVDRRVVIAKVCTECLSYYACTTVVHIKVL